MSRSARAVAAGAAAAGVYYAAAALGSHRPVRLGGLLALSFAALAGNVIQGSRASAKAYEVESRLNQFFSGGGQVGGDLVVNGNHTVNGSHTVNGNGTINGNHNITGNADVHGVSDFHGSGGHDCLNNVSEVNKGGGGDAGVWGAWYTNGHPVRLGGGTQGTATVIA